MALILTASADGRERRPGGDRSSTHRRRRLEQARLAREPAPSDADRRQLGDAAGEQPVGGGVQRPVTRLVSRGGQRQVQTEAGGGGRLGQNLGVIDVVAAAEREAAQRQREGTAPAVRSRGSNLPRGL
jgi:hypothetical protein